MVPRRWESETRKFGTKQVDRSQISTGSSGSWTLEVSPTESSYGGNLTYQLVSYQLWAKFEQLLRLFVVNFSAVSICHYDLIGESGFC